MRRLKISTLQNRTGNVLDLFILEVDTVALFKKRAIVSFFAIYERFDNSRDREIYLRAGIKIVSSNPFSQI